MPEPKEGTLPFEEPWNGSLSERLSMVSNAQFRVLYFYEHPDSASFRYRCYNMAQSINSESGGARATYIFLSDLESLNNPSDWGDVLVVCRSRYDSHVERLISSFRSAGKKVFFDIDDLIFDTAHAPLVASNLNFELWGEGLDKWFSLISRMGATMKLCDDVITTNSFLSERAHTFSGLPTHVIPNFLNQEQVATSEPLAATRASRNGDGDSFVLGYFSGSKSHTKDFDVAVESIASTMVNHPHVQLLIVGHLEIPRALQHLSDRIDRVNFTDYLSLQGLIAQADLCLAPLQDSIFTYAKSQLKFFEAGVVGVPTMATPSPVFSEAISHGKNGYLAAGGAWGHMLDEVITQGLASSIQVGSNAQKSAMEHFGPDSHTTHIREVLGAN